MTGQLLHGERRVPHSAGQAGRRPTQATPATGSGCPHDVRQRIVRGQTAGLARRPGQVMGVGLGATGRRGISLLGIDPLWILIPHAVVMGRDLDAMLMSGQLLDREGRAADSAGQSAG